MDSYNTADIKNIQVNSRNTASNTNPIACASCGSEDYMQTFSQPNCFRPFCTGPISIKHLLSNCEDNFAIHPSVYPGFPFFQPFFNGQVSPNICFGNNSLDKTSLNVAFPENIIKGKSETQKNEILFSQRDKVHQKQDSKSKDSEKENPWSEPTFQFPPNQLCSYLQGCPCKSSIPWVCNPFIVPMISYYVLWNSNRLKVNQSTSNSGMEDESTPQINKDCSTEGKTFDVDKKQYQEKFNLDCIDLERETEDNDEKKQVKVWTPDKSKKIDLATNNQESETSSLLSLNSTNYSADDSNGVQEIKNDILFKNYPEICDIQRNLEEDEQNKFLDSFSVKEVISNSQETSTSLKNLEVREKDNNVAEEDIKFYVENSEKDGNEDSIEKEVKPKFSSSDDLNPDFINSETLQEKSSSLTEEFDKETLQSVETNLKDKTVKKFIKNFTMTNQPKIECIENTINRISASAAAGDLGGKNCLGYRVSIPASENISEDKMQETQTEGISEHKGLSISVKARNTENLKMMYTDPENKKTVKSGIAKLSNNFKCKDSTNNYRPHVKQDKKPTASKRKHNCCLIETKTDNDEKSSKIHKTKVFAEYTGLDNQNLKNKLLNAKGQFHKKEEKGKLNKTRNML